MIIKVENEEDLIKKRNCIEEGYYIALSIMDFMENPKQKTGKVKDKFDWFKKNLPYILLFALIFVCAIIVDSETYIAWPVLIIVCIFIAIVVLRIIYINILLKKALKSNVAKTITINEDGIESLKENGKKYIITWENLKYVIINQYCICIMPNNVKKRIITLDKKYQKDVIKALKKYSKEDLLIDNSNLYK